MSWLIRLASAPSAGFALAALVCSVAAGQSVHETSSATVSRLGERLRMQAPDGREVAGLIVEETNAFRAEHDLPAIAENASLRAAAAYFAGFMAQNDKYGHTADGDQPIDRARDKGYEPCIVGENIGWQFSSRTPGARELAERFVKGWEQSKEHRRNMLDPDMTETGVAVACSEKTGDFYAVQMFGRPKSLSLHVSLANRAGATIDYELADRQFSLPDEYTRIHELCRPTELTLHDPDHNDEEKGLAIRIKVDGSYIIGRGDDGRLRVTPDRSSAAQQRPQRR